MTDEERERWLLGTRQPKILVIVGLDVLSAEEIAEFLLALDGLNRVQGGKGYIIAHQDGGRLHGAEIARFQLAQPDRSRLSRVRDAFAWWLFRAGLLPWQVRHKAGKVSIRVRA